MKAAVTGMGCVCALGHSTEECLDNLYQGTMRSALPRRPNLPPEACYPVFDAPPHPAISEQDNERLLRTNEFLLLAANEAATQAGMEEAGISPSRIGVVIGTTVGCSMNNEAFYLDYRRHKQPSMVPITRYLNNNPALLLRKRHSWTGPAQTVNTACASGADAIGVALSWLEAGVCDVVVAGGADELCRVVYNGFISLKVYSAESPKPFSRTRSGLNLGEGAGVLVLARPECTPSPLGFVAGYGTASDAYHPTAPDPEGKGLRNAISASLAQAGMEISDIGYINAHGTATPDNDRVEAKVFREMLPEIPFTSTKSQTGHTLGAAGAIEAVFTIGILRNGTIPAAVGFEEPDPELACAPLATQAHIGNSAALTTSLAFGGTNSAIVLTIPE